MTTPDAPTSYLASLTPRLLFRCNQLPQTTLQHWAMSPSRTAALLLNLHNPHSTGTPSFCLPSCSTRSFFARHGTSRGRPTRPRTRHSPVSRPAITPFSTSTRRLREPNHYEALDLPVTATAGEIKKYAGQPTLNHFNPHHTPHDLLYKPPKLPS